VDRQLGAEPPARTNTIGWLRVVARREAIRLAQYDRRLATLTFSATGGRRTRIRRPSMRARRSGWSRRCL
jgi:hypothetical protein